MLSGEMGSETGNSLGESDAERVWMEGDPPGLKSWVFGRPGLVETMLLRVVPLCQGVGAGLCLLVSS